MENFSMKCPNCYGGLSYNEELQDDDANFAGSVHVCGYCASIVVVPAGADPVIATSAWCRRTFTDSQYDEVRKLRDEVLKNYGV